MSVSFFSKKKLLFFILLLPFLLKAVPEKKYFPIHFQNNKNNRGITFGDGVFQFDNSYNQTSQIWVLNKNWKYASGDDTTWVKSDFDDSKWDTTVTTQLNLSEIKQGAFAGACWFRLHLSVDSLFRNKSLRMFFLASGGAADVYVDGKLVFRIGKFSVHQKGEETKTMLPHSIFFNNDAYHTIAIRYSNFEQLNYFFTKYDSQKTIGFTAFLVEDNFASTLEDDIHYMSSIFIAIVAFYFAMTIVHFLLFIFYREQKSNLYYFLFTLSVSGYLYHVHGLITGSQTYLLWQHLLDYMGFGIGFFMVGFLYSVFYVRMSKMFRILLALNIFILLAKIFVPESHDTLIGFLTVLSVLLFITEFIEAIRVTIFALIKKKEGAWIMALGVLFLPSSVIILVIVGILSSVFKFNDSSLLPVFFMAYSIVCIPISMSIYLARNFSLVNKNLKNKLVEVEKLSAQTIQQEQEKKKILENQNDELEKQVSERTAELVLQKKETEEKNKNITDSIQYAKKIQEAMLPETSYIRQFLPYSFVLFQPRDIVSGDFYWFCDLSDNSVLIAVADCTGHGVPGAFMSMIGHTLLDEIVKEKKIITPALILDELNDSVRMALKQNQGESRDGMDIALCKINTQNKKVEYAGAMRPIWIYNQQGELTEIKANKQAIGGIDTTQKTFTNHELELNVNDTIYLSTDGYADQFGGNEGKKMMVKKFKKLLSEIVSMPFESQQQKLAESFRTWKDNNEQVDDVLVVGIKL